MAVISQVVLTKVSHLPHALPQRGRLVAVVRTRDRAALVAERERHAHAGETQLQIAPRVFVGLEIIFFIYKCIYLDI